MPDALDRAPDGRALAASLGPLGVWGHLDTLAAPQLRRYVRRVAELGYGCLWVAETVGREPFTLLGAVAADAGGMWLGTSIASIWSRDAMATRMGAFTLHELTGGRFVLGLGVSHPHLAQRLRGHAYEKPLTRMREYLEAYRALPYLGPTLSGDEGVPTQPPIILAALRERMLALAAQSTAGAFPFHVTTERVAWTRAVLDAATPDPAAPAARPLLAASLPVILEEDPVVARATARAYLAPYVRAPNYQASWAEQGFGPEDWAKPGSDRLVDAMVAWGPVEAVRARIAALHAAGADHVTIVPVSPDGTTERLATLEALAPGR
jgi:probable F420-dependent oxidoreductase